MKRNSFWLLAASFSLLIPFFASPIALADDQEQEVVAPAYTETTDLAKTYVTQAYDAWAAKTAASQARIDADKAQEAASVAKEEYLDALAEAVVAEDEYETKRQITVNFMREVIKDPSLSASTPPALQAITMGAEDTFELARGIKHLENASEKRQQATVEADIALKAAEAARLHSEDLLDDAEKAEEKAAELLEESKKKDTESAALLQSARGTLSKASSELNSTEILAGIEEKLPASQRVLNEAVTKEWKSYKKELSKNKKLLPDQNDTPDSTEASKTVASRVFQRGATPGALTLPVLNEDGTTQVGVVQSAKTGTVLLSDAAIDRVQTAIDYLGTPYSDLTCHELVSTVSGHKETQKLETLFSSTYQNQSISDTLPGDIVFFADAHGISQAGVSIGGGLVVVSSASSRSVIVTEINDNTLISTRPGVDYKKKNLQKAPASSKENNVAWECGGIASSFGSVSGGAWVLPYGDRDYDTTLEYKAKDDRFKKDVSPGALFSSKKHAVVQSAFAGTATIKDSGKRGLTITLRYNDSLSIRYSGLSKSSVTDGTFVGVGDPIAVTGKSGSIFEGEKNPGVFVESLVNGEPVDPEFMFFPPEAAGESAYPNGMIPADALCPAGIGSHRLRCDAAQGFESLNEAYKSEFGVQISVTDSYRDYPGQVRCRQQKGNMCATPGKSNHGWGLALDLGGGINSFGTKEYKWMIENAPLFGWQNPNWARQNGSNPEAWHFEFFSAVE